MKKKIIILSVLLILPVVLSAQTKGFREFYDKYAGKKGYTAIEMSGAMFGLMGDKINVKGDDKEVSNLMNQISNLVIIVSEDSDPDFVADVDNMVKNGDYVVMTTIRDGEQTIQFLTSNKKGKTAEFLMTVIGGDGDNVVMNIVGEDLDVSQVTRLVTGD